MKSDVKMVYQHLHRLMLVSNSSHLKFSFESPRDGIKSPCRFAGAFFTGESRQGLLIPSLGQLCRGDVEKSGIKNERTNTLLHST